MKHKLFIATREQEFYRDEIARRALPGLVIEAPLQPTSENLAASGANIILGNPNLLELIINSASNLEWVQATFTGVDSLIKPSLRRDYILTNVRDAYGEIIAEYVFAYIFYIEKEIGSYLEHQRNRTWNQKESTSIRGKVIGVLGVGSLGKQIARIAQAFGMKTLGLRRSATPVEHFDDVYTKEHSQKFYSQCDYLVAALPQTENTAGIIDKNAFALMKSSAIFLNVGRGGAVVEKDLIEALHQKLIRAAVLDVFIQEPLAKDHPFWNTPNLFVTPHVSGYLNSKRIFDIFEENYRRFLSGESLKYQVDFAAGY